MTANFLGMFEQVGALAKCNAEAGAARSARVAGAMQDGYRRLIEGVTAGVGETTHFVGELSKVRSPADLAAVQREWVGVAQARIAGQVKTVMDVSSKIAAELAAAATPVTSAAAAAPAVAVAKAPAPQPKPAAAPVAAAVVAEAPVTAPVAPPVAAPVETKVETVLAESQAPVVEPAPTVNEDSAPEAPAAADAEAAPEASAKAPARRAPAARKKPAAPKGVPAAE